MLDQVDAEPGGREQNARLRRTGFSHRSVLSFFKAVSKQKAKLLHLLCRFSSILRLSIVGDILLLRLSDFVRVDFCKIILH